MTATDFLDRRDGVKEFGPGQLGLARAGPPLVRRERSSRG